MKYKINVEQIVAHTKDPMNELNTVFALTYSFKLITMSNRTASFDNKLTIFPIDV